VPTRHEEVSVERVPLSGEPSEAEIGEDEVRVPLTDEEVRVRKDVVEDTEMVEEDVRREEIDVEDETTRRVS
jgi:stress response protein YsnF